MALTSTLTNHPSSHVSRHLHQPRRRHHLLPPDRGRTGLRELRRGRGRVTTCTHKPFGGRVCGRVAEWWWRAWSGAAYEPRCSLHAPGVEGESKVRMRGESNG